MLPLGLIGLSGTVFASTLLSWCAYVAGTSAFIVFCISKYIQAFRR